MYVYQPDCTREWQGLEPRPEPDWQRFHRSIDRLLEIVEKQDEKIRFLEMRIGLLDKAETKFYEDLRRRDDVIDQLSYGLGILENKLADHLSASQERAFANPIAIDLSKLR